MQGKKAGILKTLDSPAEVRAHISKTNHKPFLKGEGRSPKVSSYPKVSRPPVLASVIAIP